MPSFGYEVVPEQAAASTPIAPRTAYYFPQTGTGVQLLYRLSTGLLPGQRRRAARSLGLRAETIEGRVYQQVTSNLEMRLLFRYHCQNNAQLLVRRGRRLGPTELAVATPRRCGRSPTTAADPKLGGLVTKYPELKVVWDGGALRDLPFFDGLPAGSFEVSYGYFLQTTSFGGAHLLQAGYRLPY